MVKAAQFNKLAKKRSSDLCRKYNLKFQPSDDSNPLLRIILENNYIQLRFLYGPPEFHVELAFTDKSSKHKKEYSLGDLANIPRIMTWLKGYVADKRLSDFEAEIDWLCQLLEEFGDELILEPKCLLQGLNK